MTYEKFIQNILNTRGRFACGDEYYERHHIVPKCMGGTDDNDNLIDLYAREHFEAHRLLALENPNVKGLIYAWHRMSCGGNDKMDSYKLTPEEYEEMKKVYSEMRRKEATGVKQSQETIEKRVSKLRGKPRSEETKRKMSEAKKGKPVPEETKEKIRKKLVGKPQFDKRKPMTEDQRLSHCNYIYYSPELNEYFYSAGEIERKYNINHQNVILCVNGKRETCGKHPITGEKLHWIREERVA